MAQETWKSRRFLIVEPDDAFRAWAEATLKKAGAPHIRAVGGGREALEVQLDFKAEVVLIDLALKDTNPFELLRHFQKLVEVEGLPYVVGVAAEAKPELLRQACVVGMHSFVRRPTDEAAFVRRVSGAVGARRFVFNRRYFGPDRRKAQQPFEGPEKRASAHRYAPAVRPKGKGEGIETAAPPRDAPSTTVDAALAAASEAALRAVASRSTPRAAPAAPAGGSAASAKARSSTASTATATTVAATAKPPPASPTPQVAARRPPVAERTAAAPAAAASAAKASRAAEDDWSTMLIDDQEVLEATGAAPKLDLKSLVGNHLQWLQSGGRSGQRADLRGADLHGSDLSKANLSNADLRSADLSNCLCRETIFQGADLRQVDFTSADIAGGDMAVARLRHSVLHNTRLDGVSLRGADLAGASFRGASLREVDLTGANLLSTDLRGADLSDVRGLTQTQLNKALADGSTTLPVGLRLPPKE